MRLSHLARIDRLATRRGLLTSWLAILRDDLDPNQVCPTHCKLRFIWHGDDQTDKLDAALRAEINRRAGAAFVAWLIDQVTEIDTMLGALGVTIDGPTARQIYEGGKRDARPDPE